MFSIRSVRKLFRIVAIIPMINFTKKHRNLFSYLMNARSKNDLEDNLNIQMSSWQLTSFNIITSWPIICWLGDIARIFLRWASLSSRGSVRFLHNQSRILLNLTKTFNNVIATHRSLWDWASFWCEFELRICFCFLWVSFLELRIRNCDM